MVGLFKHEIAVRTVCGGVLWFLSGLLTAGLFVSLSDDLATRVVLVGLTVGLEGAKILAWRMGGWRRLLSISLITLSMLASVAAALSTVQTYRSVRMPMPDPQTLFAQRQQTILLDRLSVVPKDFTTAAREINQELKDLRTSINPRVETRVSDSVFDLLARSISVPVEEVILAILLFLAVNVEVAALVLADPVRPKAVGKLHRLFLKAAMDGAPLPVLHGRDKTAKKLGLSYYLAKRIVHDLEEQGVIRAVGKRLVLCDTKATPKNRTNSLPCLHILLPHP